MGYKVIVSRAAHDHLLMLDAIGKNKHSFTRWMPNEGHAFLTLWVAEPNGISAHAISLGHPKP